MQATYTVPPVVDRFQRNGLVAGVLGLILSVVGLLAGSEQFFHSYLIGFMYVFSIPMGCLGLLMLQHLTGGAWGMMIRRILEAAAGTIPLIFAAFLPILLWKGHIYSWVNPDIVGHSKVLMAKQSYLNDMGFVVRGVCYFVIWFFLSYFLTTWSAKQDQMATARMTRKFQLLSSGGFLLLIITMTLASTDWLMSLDPEWFSTIYGLLTIAGQAIASMAFVIIMVTLLMREKPMSELILPVHLHDLGKLLFAFVMLWAYFSFSQFLIIWSGNLPEEIIYFLDRMRGGWVNVAYIIILGHFFLPFFSLLPRNNKRNPKVVRMIAAWLLVMRLIDLYWLAEPSYHRGDFYFHWLDLALPLALAGIWFAFFCWQLKRMPLLPVNDPYLEESLHPVGGH